TEQGALAGAVGAEDADAFAVADAQGDVAQGRHRRHRIAVRPEHMLQDILFESNLILLAHPEDQTHAIQLNRSHEVLLASVVNAADRRRRSSLGGFALRAAPYETPIHAKRQGVPRYGVPCLTGASRIG